MLCICGGSAGAFGAEPAEPTATEREVADHLLHGNRQAALQLFADIARDRYPAQAEAADKLETLQWSAAEARGLAEAYLQAGQFAQARAVLAPHLGKHAQPETVLLRAEIERQNGTAAGRLKLLMAAAQQHPKHLPLRVALGEALYETGKRTEARQLLDPLADLYQDGAMADTADLLAVAQSLALNGYFKDALSVLDKAEAGAAEPAEKLQANLALGLLYLQKYNYRDSDMALRKVLQINPHHAEALAAMARIDVASDGDLAKARKRIDDVLQDQPAALAARTMRAEIALHDEDLDEARRQIQKALDQRGDFADAIAVQGAIAKLSDDEALWKKAEAAAQKLNPADAGLYVTAASYLEMAHRYREVRLLLQKAIERDGDAWQAHAALGVAYARVADDAKAKKELETAFAGDPYDVRTANQLTVLYDDVLKQMVLLPGRRADLRVHKADRKVLERAVLPFLQDSAEALDKAYGLQAKRPLQFEIFPQVQQFAVRTVGLPQMGAHAVCFGHLITSRSPISDPFNWKMVLFHELSHVYHIQATDGRVPRWLTEGLAMMETVWANPRWRQANDRRAWERLQNGQLAKIAKFNLAFSQARSMQDIFDAYDQAMREVEFLAERFGKDKVRQLALSHASGKPTTALVQEVLGQSPEALDAAFAEWLGQNLKQYRKDFRVDGDQLAKKLQSAESKSTAGGAFQDAIKAMQAGDRAKAMTLLTQVLLANKESDPDLTRQAAYLRMEMAAATGNKAETIMHAQFLVNLPNGRGDGLRQRAILFHAALGDHKPAVAVQHLRGAQAIAPNDPVTQGLLRDAMRLAATAVLQPGKRADADEWLKALAPQGLAQLRQLALELADREPHDGGAALLLGELAWQAAQAGIGKTAKDPAAVALAAQQLQTAAEQLEERDPANPQALILEARGQWAAGNGKAALPLYRMAADRAKTPQARTQAWCEAAKLAAEAGDPAEKAEAERHCGVQRAPDGKAPGEEPADDRAP